MHSLGKVIDSAIKGDNHFCCLCLNNIKLDQEDSKNVHDVIITKINNSIQKITIYEILQSLFSKDIHEYILTFENICEKCVQSAINSFTFIQTTKSNSLLLIQTLDHLISSTDYVNDNDTSKTLYMLCNTEIDQSKHIYDNIKVNSVKMASNRLHILNNVKKDMLSQIKIKEKKKDIPKITLKEMLFDPNDKSTLKCKWCLKVFRKKWLLRNHYLNSHVSKEYKCTQCSLLFCSKLFLKMHEESHTKFSCSKCGKVYKNSHSLKAHEKRHSLSLVCPDCGRVYRNKNTYNSHIEHNVCKQDTIAYHSNAKFTCDYCNKKYTHKISLRVHIQFEHGNYKVHICEWCGKKFWAQSRLKAHIVKHTKEKNFLCSICNGKFVTKEALLYHTRLHTGEKPYKCTQCNSRFLSSSRRAMHMKKCHAGSCLQCDFCSCTFNSRIYLEKHRKTHYSDQQNTNNFVNQDVQAYYVDNELANTSKMIEEVPLADLKEISGEDVHNFIYQIKD